MRAAFEESVERPEPVVRTRGEIPLAAGAKEALEFAVEEANLMQLDYVGTEHLLLGILRVKYSIASKALVGMGVTLERRRGQNGDRGWVG